MHVVNRGSSEVEVRRAQEHYSAKPAAMHYSWPCMHAWPEFSWSLVQAQDGVQALRGCMYQAHNACKAASTSVCHKPLNCCRLEHDQTGSCAGLLASPALLHTCSAVQGPQEWAPW